MSLDALFGKVYNNGIEVELGGGFDFHGGAAFNPTTKVIDIVAATAGAGGSGSGTQHAAAVILGTADTHSGLAARDGVTLVAGDLVLDVAHATPSLRGWYEAAAGAWSPASFFNTDAEVSSSLGSLAYIKPAVGSVGGGRTYQQTAGETLAASKTYVQILGNPDTVIGENGSVTRLGHDVRISTRKIETGSNYIDVALVQGAAASVLWSFDAAGLGFSAKALIALAANIMPRWPSDDKSTWATSATHWRHEIVTPILIETRAQQGLDGAGGANNYIALSWALSGTVIQLKGQNLRAASGDCIGSGVINFLAVDTV